MNEIVIKIYEVTKDGYIYDISGNLDENLCIAALENALDKTCSHAKDIIRRSVREANAGRG